MAGFVPVEDLDVYHVAEELADAIWNAALSWDYFARDTLGKQLVRAADSVGANIAEGAGEEGAIENRRYLRYARRSLRETRWHLRRAHKRGLLKEEQTHAIRDLVDRMGRLMTGYTRAVNERCHRAKPATHRLTDSPTHRGTP